MDSREMSEETNNDTPTPDSEREPASSPSTTLVAQAEAVFESYLAARVVNARRELTSAKVALLRDPRNRARLEAIRRAETDVEKLQAQLIEQKRNAARARARMDHTSTTPATPLNDASHLTSTTRPDGDAVSVPIRREPQKK
jgi:hypothetical protein